MNYCFEKNSSNKFHTDSTGKSKILKFRMKSRNLLTSALASKILSGRKDSYTQKAPATKILHKTTSTANIKCAESQNKPRKAQNPKKPYINKILPKLHNNQSFRNTKKTLQNTSRGSQIRNHNLSINSRKQTFQTTQRKHTKTTKQT
jgi:hypothetical protein